MTTSQPSPKYKSDLDGFSISEWLADESKVAFFDFYPDAPLLVVDFANFESRRRGAVTTTERFSDFPKHDDLEETACSSKNQFLSEIGGESTVYFLAKDADQPYQDRIMLGRTPSTDVFLPVPTISRLQVCFEKHGEEWHVKDLGSTNGTHVGGRHLANQETMALGNAMEMGLGPHVRARFFTRQGFELLLKQLKMDTA
ncbi:MAG: FHA domain-containing protein [Planctomycetota bacterium]|nr:FHA domain-containing protein [Planctomycetota bacterium]